MAKTHENQQRIDIVSIVFYYVGVMLEEIILGRLPSCRTVSLLLSRRMLFWTVFERTVESTVSRDTYSGLAIRISGSDHIGLMKSRIERLKR